MQITATVPMRVDLAGGTLDVYPIYLFEGGGLTLNAAISIEARVHLSTRKDDVITITSTDLGVQESIDSIAHLRPGGPLSMVHYALLHYLPEGGLDISIESQAPTGSGLGASSALLMALSSALYALAGRSLDYQRIIDTGANIEAQVIGIPTGKQDYFPPLYGGLCAMWFEIGGWRLESLSTDRELLRLLSDRLIVSYTGVPHDSAVTNWAMLKRYIEKQGDTVARMRDIKAIALNMYSALRNRDFCGFYRLVDSEWQLRHGLAEG
ncbi:MAG: hypothetical protein GXY79_11545, partial [Chloroflexi bacterium]|nr:hypothetical protein [Chloroflexota bacterium]